MIIFLLALICHNLNCENSFFFEQNNNYPVKIGVEIEEKYETLQSPYEKIDIYKTKQCGNMLVLDDVIQLTQWDNFTYHEMIAHVPLMNHPAPKRVLIIGGGDLGALSEIVKHQDLVEIVLCDIDEEVIRLSTHYFPEFASSARDKRVTIIAQDAAQFIKNYSNYFDIIIVDASDPVGPGLVLYSEEFYQDIHHALTHDGIVVSQGESPFFHADLIKEWHARNQRIFAYADYYYTLVPTYPSGTMGFNFCSKKYTPPDALHFNRSAPENLLYYTRELHQACFVLPAFMRLTISALPSKTAASNN